MRIVVADNHPQRLLELRRIVSGEGLTCESDDAVGFDSLAARLAEVQPELVLVHCNGVPEQCFSAINMAHSVTRAPILACGNIDDSHAIRNAIKAGCREFLSMERLREELADVIKKIESEGELPQERGTAISLFSPCGGAGVSTMAVNLAVRLARRHPQQVALVDMKPAPSDLALLLNIESKHTVDQVSCAWQRLDRKMLQKSMTPHRCGMHVLVQTGYPPHGGLPENTLTRESVRQLTTLLLRSYAITVLDLDNTLSEETIEAMRHSNIIALVARPDVPGLRRARWALDTAVSMGVGRDRFRLVLNRFGGRGQISARKAEQLLDTKVMISIPENRGAANISINRGVPLVEISKLSRIGRSFSSLARCVNR